MLTMTILRSKREKLKYTIDEGPVWMRENKLMILQKCICIFGGNTRVKSIVLYEQ